MMEFHPLADEFPLIEGEAFEALVQSIKEQGQLEPIVVCDGKILDGRNRYRACLKLGIEPELQAFESTDPHAWVRWVKAKNLTRRHLTDTQRAMIAARMSSLEGMTIDNAAIAMNVGSRTAQKASVIARHGSANVVDLVQRGATTINKAYKATTGIISEAQIDVDRRKSPGRKPGNHHVNVLRNILTEFEKIYDYGDKIVNHFPDDPHLHLQLARAAKFLPSLLARIREDDNAATAVA